MTPSFNAGIRWGLFVSYDYPAKRRELGTQEETARNAKQNSPG